MRAVAVEQFRAPLRLVEVRKPELQAQHVMLQVAAAGVNPVDWKLADGLYEGTVEAVFPFILGVDAVGTVTEVAAGVTRFKVGDRVAGEFFSHPSGRGTYAEYVSVAEKSAALMPSALSDELAAALPTAGMTAMGMVDSLDLKPGAKVLLVGATGSVGRIATQLAAARGFTVLATAAEAAAADMLALGASETFVHHAGDLGEQVSAAHSHGVDVLLDLVSDPAQFQKLSALVSVGGYALSTIHAADAKLLKQRRLQGGNFVVKGDPSRLRQLASLVVEGKLKVRIERTISLDEVPAAIAEAKAGHARGKTIIKVARS
jgi:NADPH2:quinone reductase